MSCPDVIDGAAHAKTSPHVTWLPSRRSQVRHMDRYRRRCNPVRQNQEVAASLGEESQLTW